MLQEDSNLCQGWVFYRRFGCWFQSASQKHQCHCPFYLPHSGTYIQCSICVFALCWVSLCAILCVIHLATSSHSLASFVSVCVYGCKASLLFSLLKETPYDQRDTQTRHQAKHNSSRRRADTYSMITWEVSMVASTGSAIQRLLVLLCCRYDCSSSSLFKLWFCMDNTCGISCLQNVHHLLVPPPLT